MTTPVDKRVARSRLLRLTPRLLRTWARRVGSTAGYDLAAWRRGNPYAGSAREWGNETGSAFRLGILFDFAHEHKNYIAACLDLNVSYRVVDVSADDWQARLTGAACDAWLVWPSVNRTAWKRMFDDRVRIMVEEMGLVVYPGWKELWLYESKLRVRDWLLANSVPHPRTWIFYRREDADDFVRRAAYPIVFKTDLGASAHGVVICRRLDQARRMVKRAFGSGVRAARMDPRDRQRGVVLFQEYLSDVREWRMVRIGQYYFCRFKEKKGEFHSGSGSVRWERPDRRLLDLIRSVTERAGFTSMNLDVFETTDGRLLVNEMHTVFGDIAEANRERGGEAMGRWRYDEAGDAWLFEPGYFYQNACANLRVEYLLQRLAARGTDSNAAGGAAP